MDKFFLSELKDDQIAKIICIKKGSPYKYRRRLLELGFLNGEQIKVVNKSILKDVLLVDIRGFELSIRKSIADIIYVERV